MSDVFFVNARVEGNRGLLRKFGELVDRVGLDAVGEGDLVAVKVHFGDDGTTRYLRHGFARVVVDRLRARGASPFLTDTLTLYKGARSTAPGHIELAIRNGFGFAQVNAPIILADGLRSKSSVEVEVGLKHFRSVRIAQAAHEADALVCLSHFKGHLAAGFGGTIKNLSLGLAPRSQKQKMHASVRPTMKDPGKCVGCGDCAEVCPAGAVEIRDGRAWFDDETCEGCAECITTCTEGALEILWNEGPDGLQEKMVEVAAGALRPKAGRAVFFSFVLEVTPDCDCFPWSDTPFVQDVGILASRDPVAIEQASVDLVNAQPGIAGSKLASAFEPGEDKFRALYPKVDWSRQLAYAEEVGLGTRRYRLVELGR
jgi:uncharacterized Fe-S center protein